MEAMLLNVNVPVNSRNTWVTINVREYWLFEKADLKVVRLNYWLGRES